MVCIPLSNHAMHFFTTFLRHYAEKGESYHFENQLPMMAEAYRGILDYSAKKFQQLRIYYEGTSEYEMKGYSWASGTLLNSMDFTKNNLWWVQGQRRTAVLDPPRRLRPELREWA